LEVYKKHKPTLYIPLLVAYKGMAVPALCCLRIAPRTGYKVFATPKLHIQSRQANISNDKVSATSLLPQPIGWLAMLFEYATRLFRHYSIATPVTCAGTLQPRVTLTLHRPFARNYLRFSSVVFDGSKIFTTVFS